VLVPFVAFVGLDVGGLVVLDGLVVLAGFVELVPLVPLVPLVVLAGLGGPLAAGFVALAVALAVVTLLLVVDEVVGLVLVLLAYSNLDS